jgi:methylenetetrahydrofolate reductase (NADPH)
MPHTSTLRDQDRFESKHESVTDALVDRALVEEISLSFEFFPPKDEAAEARLWAAFDGLMKVNPDFVSVTYGAGGSNRATSLAIVERMAKEVLTIGHLTCVGSTVESSIEIIRAFEGAGVGSILALRGDSPKDQPDALANGEIKTAVELVDLIANHTELEIGVAAFPEVHPESPNLAHDAKVLSLKEQAGASYAITQLFFTVDAYLTLLDENEAAGVGFLPIIPGLMPIGNAKQVIRMAQMSGAQIPTELLGRLEAADEATARRIGMEYSIKLARDLVSAGAPGLHIFTLNQQDAAIELARGAGLCR